MRLRRNLSFSLNALSVFSRNQSASLQQSADLFDDLEIFHNVLHNAMTFGEATKSAVFTRLMITGFSSGFDVVGSVCLDELNLKARAGECHLGTRACSSTISSQILAQC